MMNIAPRIVRIYIAVDLGDAHPSTYRNMSWPDEQAGKGQKRKEKGSTKKIALQVQYFAQFFYCDSGD